MAYYSARPKDPKRTKEKGYMKDPVNFDYDESINITRGLKNKDVINARVILNLNQQQVTKNTFNDNNDFPTLLAHYQEGYPKYINPLLGMIYPEINDAVVDVQEEEKEGS